jgi:DNA-binding transcriptional regulator LsrR (DeoR family)
MKKRGRKRALNDEQAYRARWMYANTSCSMERIAQHLRVSQGVIQQVIDRKGAYTELTKFDRKGAYKELTK